MAASDHVLFELDDGVGIVTLNRPERLNAVTWDMAGDVAQLFREIRQRDEVRAVVLTGAGRAFCSGGDAEFLSGSGDRPLPGLSSPDKPMPRYQRKTPAGTFADVTRMIVDVEKPVIAAIAGPAVGAGLAYALACDRRFADPTARTSAIFVRLGFSPDCGLTYFLPRIVGVSTALMMVATGDVYDAERVARDGTHRRAGSRRSGAPGRMEYARRLARGPSVAIDLARRVIHKSLTSTLEEILDYEAVVATLTAATRDAREGTSSFVEKRKPEFKGF